MKQQCKNCFTSIDLRTAVTCNQCGKPLHKECAINDGGTFCDVCYTVKQEGGSSMGESITIPDIIRRSYVELYKSCPYAFYLTVVKGVETEPSSFAQIGIDLHELFEKACKGEIQTMPQLLDTYKDVFAWYEDKLFEQDLHLYKDMSLEKFKKKMWEQVIDATDSFFNILHTLPTNPFALEENIILNVGEGLPKLSITMDRVDEVDGMLEVCDWKTGAVKVGQALSSDLQAPLYIKAISEHYGKKVRKFTFYYLPENKVRVWERVDDDNYVCIVNKREYKINITDAIREVQSIFAQIIKKNFNIPKETKKMYFTCKTCYYKRCEMCEGADMQAWKQYNRKE